MEMTIRKVLVRSTIYPGREVIKDECIGRVQKRIGNRLRKRRKTKGLGRPGRLNDMINFNYGTAIRRNSGKTV